MSVYGSFVRSLIMPNIKYAGIEFWENYRLLEKTQWMTREDLERLQWKKLKAIITHAYEHVPYYRSLFKMADVTPFDIKSPEDMLRIPITTKEDFRENFPENVIAKNIGRKNWILNSTSGSTGSPFEFIIDRNLIDVERATLLRGYRWAGLEFGDRFITIWGSHNESLGRRVFERYIKRRLMLSAFGLDDGSMAEYVRISRRYRPCLIEGYASAVIKFSEYVLEKRINDIQINSVITSAENLIDSHRATIESALKCKVFDRYGSREFGTVAHECEKHEGLHVNTENFFVEFVDEDGKPVDGKSGRMIVTSFDNLAMPFIRYETGDLGTPTERKCSCGRGLPILDSVDGRVTDFIHVSSRKIPFLFFNYFFEGYGKLIREFQVIQKREDLIQVLIVPSDSFNMNTEESIKSGLEKNLGGSTRVYVELVEAIPLEKSGKRPIVRLELHKN